MDRDTRHTFGCISPRINEDIDERHVMVSMGTHKPIPPLYRLQAQMIWLLSFDTLGMSSRVWGAHLRYLDATQCARGDTSQRWHWVRARSDRYKFGECMVFYGGSVCSTLEFTLKGMHDTFWARHSEVSLEHIH